MCALFGDVAGYVHPYISREMKDRTLTRLVTCAPVSSLRTLPLKRLKEYLAAYNIPYIGPKEKEDFVQAIMKARNPQTGALSPEAEVSLVVEAGR